MSAGIVENRLEAAVARAVRVVEESVNSSDPYFAHEAAVQLLKGRGKYRQAMNVKKEGSIHHQFGGSVDINQKVTIKDERAVQEMVSVMSKMAAGGEEFRPRILDAKVVKELPPAKQADVVLERKASKGASASVQKREQAEAVGGD